MLSLSAPLARKLAPQLCRKDPATGDDCCWYHGFWQYLQLMRVVATPANHAEFFRTAFSRIGGGPAAPRLLISGAADYATLAHALTALRSHGVEPETTVVDRCETPLMLNRWYAERAAHRIATHRSDMLDFADARPFDIVCTHSFLGQFASAAREALIAAWRRLLRPGGVAITVNRIRPSAGTGRVGFSALQAQAFEAAVQGKAQSMGAELGVDPAEMVQAARVYAARQSAWPVRSRGEIARLFEGAGFRLDDLSSITEEGGVRGPTTPAGAEYVCVIATRL